MVRVITQETFDDVVRENIEDLDMNEEEALSSAIEQFQAQVGVCFSKKFTFCVYATKYNLVRYKRCFHGHFFSSLMAVVKLISCFVQVGPYRLCLYSYFHYKTMSRMKSPPDVNSIIYISMTDCTLAS